MNNGEVTRDNDRRIFERINVELPVTVLTSVDNVEFSGSSCDVSARGVGVVCAESLAAGSPVEVWLRMHERRDPFYTRGVVAWSSSAEGNGTKRLGIVFEKAQLMELAAVLRVRNN